MFGPGDYVAEETQGITRVEDLPKPKILRRNRNYKRRPCSLCGHSAYRLRTATRTLHDLGDAVTGRDDRWQQLGRGERHCGRLRLLCMSTMRR